MRESNLYGVRVPELGDRADITVVSDAILSNEKDQSGKVENMKATISGNIIALVSEARTNKLKQYYNGLSIQFTSPANIGIGSTHKIKIDNLVEQPFTIKTALKVGDIVNATYGQSGFVSSTTPLHNDSAKKETNITAGKGLTGGGDLTTNRTIDIESATDGIVVNENNIELNIYDGVDSESTTRPVSARAVKTAYDKVNTKLDKSTYQGNAQDLKNEIDGKQNKTDESLHTKEKGIVPSINEIFDNKWRFKHKQLFNEDIDNLYIDGYYMYFSAGGRTIRGTLPDLSNESFILFVLSSQTGDTSRYLRQQILIDSYNNNIFVRYTSNQGKYGAWSTILREDSKTFLGQVGVNEINYIQDFGIKEKGKGYIDKDTGRLYISKEKNTDVTVTSKFETADNISNSYPLEYTNGIWFVREYKDYVELSTTQRLLYSSTEYYDFELPFSLYFDNSMVLASSCDTENQNLVSATIQPKGLEQVSNKLKVRRWEGIGSGYQYFSFYIRGKKA